MSPESLSRGLHPKSTAGLSLVVGLPMFTHLGHHGSLIHSSLHTVSPHTPSHSTWPSVFLEAHEMFGRPSLLESTGPYLGLVDRLKSDHCKYVDRTKVNHV